MNNVIYFTATERHTKAILQCLVVIDCKVRLVTKDLLDNGLYNVGIEYNTITDLCCFMFDFGAASFKEYSHE